MERIVILCFLLMSGVSSVIAQVLKLSASSDRVCVGSNVTLTADYGSATTLQWEYSTDGRLFFPLKKQLSTSLQVTMDKSYVFRVSSGLSKSNTVSVEARSPYEYNWSRSDGTKVSSGELIDVCDKVEGFSFGSTIAGEETSFREQYSSQWKMNGEIVSNDFDCVLPLVDKSGSIYQIITDKYCPSPEPFEFVFRVTPLPAVELTVDKESVCVGSDITLTANAQNAPSVVWRKQYDREPSNSILTTTAGSGTSSYSPTESGLYWLTVPSNGVCPQVLSDMVRVEVNKPFEHEWIDSDRQVPLKNGDEIVNCGPWDLFPVNFFSGKYAGLDSLAFSKTVKSEWYIDDVFCAESFDLNLYNVNKTIKLTSVITTKGCSPVPFDFNLVVKDLPQFSVADAAVCDGVSAKLKAEGENGVTYQWYADAAHRQLLSGGAELSVAPSESTIYYVVGKNGECEAEQEAQVTVGSVPTVVGQQEMNETTYRLDVEGGTGVLSFDFGEGWVNTDIFTGAQPERTYKVLVKDELGCQSEYTLETKQYELEFPEYLTPTSMPWLVGNLDKYKVTRVEIYDRIGRLLFTTSDPTEGWDGTYLGSNMPSTDYWYVVNVADKDEQYVGHFTLRR